MSPLTENFTDFPLPCVLRPRQGGRCLVCQRQRKHGKKWGLSEERLSGQSLPTAEFLVRSTIFWTALSPQALISFSAPQSPTPSANISQSMWMTKFASIRNSREEHNFVTVNSNIKWPVSHRRWAMQLLTMVATILRVVKPRTSSHSPGPITEFSACPTELQLVCAVQLGPYEKCSYARRYFVWCRVAD